MVVRRYETFQLTCSHVRFESLLDPGYGTNPPQFNGRTMVVLGPNGMPHYQTQYAAFNQSQGFEGGVLPPPDDFDPSAT